MQKLGHTAILLPAQHVRAYQRRQKNDYNDAQAIAEACQHGIIRTVPIKTLDQQDIQTFLKMPQLISMERTQLINHVRGLLAENSIVLNKGATELRRMLPALLEDAENELTDTMRTLLHRQYTRLITLDDEREWYNAEQKKIRSTGSCVQAVVSHSWVRAPGQPGNKMLPTVRKPPLSHRW